MSSKEREQEEVIILNGKPFQVPPGGSLGILALGAKGIRAWKKVKKDYEDQKKDGEKK